MSTEQVIQHNIGAVVEAVTSVSPQASTAQTLTGTSIDRQAHSMPLSAVLHTVLGAATGGPGAVSVQSTLQHSPDGTTWTNFLYDGVNTAQGAVIAAASTEQNLSVDLALAYRYLRIVTVVGFTGGTAPAVGVVAGLILGGEQTLAAV